VAQSNARVKEYFKSLEVKFVKGKGSGEGRWLAALTKVACLCESVTGHWLFGVQTAVVDIVSCTCCTFHSLSFSVRCRPRGDPDYVPPPGRVQRALDHQGTGFTDPRFGFQQPHHNWTYGAKPVPSQRASSSSGSMPVAPSASPRALSPANPWAAAGWSNRYQR
jgi:hypothetical protein